MNTNTISKFRAGFTLVKLMAIFSVMVILASIFIPAYQTYVVKTKISEAFRIGDVDKLAVVEYYTTNNDFPDDFWSGLPQTSGKYIKNVSWNTSDESLQFELNASAKSKLDGLKFKLKTTIDAVGNISWACQSIDIPVHYLPANCTKS